MSGKDNDLILQTFLNNFQMEVIIQIFKKKVF